LARLGNWIRRLERANQDNQIKIIQKDGTIAKFPADAFYEAFGHEAERFRAVYRGEDPGEAHELTEAKRNAMHPQEYVFDADLQPRKKYQAE